MDYLIDTNVLIRYSDRTQHVQPIALHAIRKLRGRGDKLRAATQNLVEFWNAATRPVVRHGFGLTIREADRRLRRIERLFSLLPDSSDIFTQWRRLVVAHNVSGSKVYDARLTAAMLVHGLTHILTFNTADFVRYGSEGIVAVDPATV